jgi:glycyl-tRNA synthetase beta chain
MSELLFEIYSEEIPASAQAPAARLLREEFQKSLDSLGLKDSEVQSFVTPRRLVLIAKDLPKTIIQKELVIRGPKVGANEQAIEGFLKRYGLSDKKSLATKTLKGEKYYFYIEKEKKVSLAKSLVKVLEEVIKTLAKSWPKTMRWGNYDIKWIRPIHNILCVFDSAILPLKFGHLTANDQTLIAGKNTHIKKDSAEYIAALSKLGIILDKKTRRESIRKDAEEIAANHKGELIINEALLDEVAGLVEAPLVLQGEIDKEFMSLPQDILITSMKHHQKYFSLYSEHGVLAPYFIFVTEASLKKNANKVIEGNQRVLKARLSDAKFFFVNDAKIKLEERVDDLKKIVFQQEIGSVHEKIERISALAKFISVWIPHADLPNVERAAFLSKADLTTEAVKEFPELQGIMGYHYAKHDGENDQVANAIRDHYSPKSMDDFCPTSPVSVAIALADKVDSLAGLFIIGKKPTASKDPFALRRSAIGVIRIILESNLNIPLKLAFSKALHLYPKSLFKLADVEAESQPVIDEVLEFTITRLEQYMKRDNIRYDLINAVFDDGNEDDILKIYRKAISLSKAFTNGRGEEITAAYKRAHNILIKSEFVGKKSLIKLPTSLLLREKDEKDLLKVLKQIKAPLNDALREENFAEALVQISYLAPVLNSFLDNVMINTEEKHLRNNRVKLLIASCRKIELVANFSKIL